MSNEYQRLARWISDIERRIGPRGLRNSSLEDGSVPEYDRSGVLGSIWGSQWDGAHGIMAVNGPVPPTPGGFEFRVLAGGLMVNWLGEWDPTEVDGQPVVAPSDFARVEIHASTSAGLSGLLRDTLKTYVSTARGSEVRLDLDYDATYYVRAITRSTTGQVSTASPVFGPFVIPRYTPGDLDIDEILGNTIFYSATTPTTTRIGDLWLKWVNSPAVPAQYETYRWDGDSWELLKDQQATSAALAAEAAQAAADLKAQFFSQDTAPAGLGPTDRAIWVETDAGNRSWSWSGTVWVSRLIGNAAIQPASLVASELLVTGSVNAALLEAIMVLATTIISGDPLGEHVRIDGTAVTAIAPDVDGLPVEVGRFGRGWGVRSPVSGDVVGSMSDEGVLAAQTLSTTDADPSFGGTLLSETLWNLPRGLVAYARYNQNGSISATTNTELGFQELSFIREPGRSYAVFIEASELSNQTDPGGAWMRMRYTLDGSGPGITSTLLRQFNRPKATDGSWNDNVPYYALINGPVLGDPADEMRLLFSYAVGTGSQASTGTAITRTQTLYIWVEDIGPTPPETGDENGGGGGVASGTPPPGAAGTAKKNYVYESTANWVRTWNQSNSIIHETELHQGYGDSFNGIRKAAAGWTAIPSMTGAVVTTVEVYMESFHFWNMSGGTLYMGYHNASSEPATMPSTSSFQSIGFTARAQGKWINLSTVWKSVVQANGFKGIGITAPSTSSTYYAKFHGPPVYTRPRVRIRYTK